MLQNEKTILEGVEFEKNLACDGKVKNRSNSYLMQVSILQCFVSMEKRNSEVVQKRQSGIFGIVNAVLTVLVSA